ncbi:hypothetical protein [Ferrovibrio sp.]|uniref:hypothetical protein n=1 Tax=Ferrovibrio sp. TaxID=1917215 RepID=UPI003D09C070
MTVNANPPRVQYIADGVQTVFGFDFRVEAGADLKVWLDALPAAGFSVAGLGNPAGGSITLSPAPAHGVRVTLQRAMPDRRDTAFVEGAEFRAVALNLELDRAVLLLQQAREVAARSLSAAPHDQAANLILPSVPARANRLLHFDAGGNVAADLPDNDGIALAAAAAAESADDAAAALVAAEAAQAAAEAARDTALAYTGGPVPFVFDGGATGYTLPVAPASADALLLFVGGVFQRPPAYSVAGTALTIPGGAPAGSRQVMGIIGAKGVALDAEAKFQHLAWEIYRLAFEKLSRTDAAATYIALAGTASYGRGALALADVVAARAYIGLEIGIGPSQQAPNWATLKS